MCFWFKRRSSLLFFLSDDLTPLFVLVASFLHRPPTPSVVENTNKSLNVHAKWNEQKQDEGRAPFGALVHVFLCRVSKTKLQANLFGIPSPSPPASALSTRNQPT